MPWKWYGVRIASIGRWDIAIILHITVTNRLRTRTISVPTEKGKTMEPYKIVMLAIVLALEIPAVIILTVGWIKAKKEARGKDNE